MRIKKISYLFAVVCFVSVSVVSMSLASPRGYSPRKPKRTSGRSLAPVNRSMSTSVQNVSTVSLEQTAKEYIDMNTGGSDILSVDDPVINKVRRLKYLKKAKGHYKGGFDYYARAQFKDMDTSEMIELDIDIVNKDSRFNSKGMKIFSVNGKKRYRYDSQGKRKYLENKKATDK